MKARRQTVPPPRRGVAAILVGCLAAAVAGCAARSDAPLDPPQKVVRAALRLLSADGGTICVDNRTTGKPLAIFATMAVAPAPARRELAWRAVTTFEAGTKLTNTQLYQDTFSGRRSLIAEPPSGPSVLSAFAQGKLDAAALALARSNQSSKVYLGDAFKVPGITARWWPMVRLSSNCDRQFTLSDPVVARDIAYITIHGEHRGITYALQPRGDDWVPVAQWNTWLF